MQKRFWIKWILILGIILSNNSVSYANKFISGMSVRQKGGAQLWVDNCSRCHNYRSPTEFTPNQWNTIMLHMRFQGGLTCQEAKEVLDYLTQSSLSEFKTKTTSTPPAPPNAPTTQAAKKTGKIVAAKLSGRAIYQKTCIGCHGSDGKGIGPAFPDFTKKGGVLSQPNNVLLNNIIHGKGGMPPRGGNPTLSDDELKAALDYIKSAFAS